MQLCFILIYRLLFFPIFLCLMPYYLLKMWRRGGYKNGFLHRFGFVPKHSLNHIIWIQAVSVGEVEALQPLMELFKHHHYNVYLTTTTSTAYRIAHKKYADLASVIAYFPLDFWLFSKLAWHRIRPQAVILMESELWPEHLYQAICHNVDAYVVNGRCSDKSFAHYNYCKPVARILFSFLTKIFASSEIDAQRFRHFCPNIFIENTGNLKVDAALCHLQFQTQNLQLESLGEHWKQSTVLLGASTWPGEEKLLLDLYQEARKYDPHLRLILVPRHAERSQEIKKLLQTYSFTFCLRTEPSNDAEIYVVNTTGELYQFLSFANFVFIGKSLDPNRGGQTPIEAASLGKPMLYGPHMENFRAICKSLEAAHGAYRCKDAYEVKQTFLAWLKDPEVAKTYGTSALVWVQNNQGAAQRIFSSLKLI